MYRVDFVQQGLHGSLLDGKDYCPALICHQRRDVDAKGRGN